ncbi:hypothetical protein HDU67_004895 [Dinochytrium kinnereticum]|nr:hypothetical protein HDU67_004895 [Dinochytrium kinnereticum]
MADSLNPSIQDSFCGGVDCIFYVVDLHCPLCDGIAGAFRWKGPCFGGSAYILWKAAGFYKPEEKMKGWEAIVDVMRFCFAHIPEGTINVAMQIFPFYLSAGLLQFTLRFQQDEVITSVILCAFPVLQIFESACILMFTPPSMASLALLSAYELVITIMFSLPSKIIRLVMVSYGRSKQMATGKMEVVSAMYLSAAAEDLEDESISWSAVIDAELIGAKGDVANRDDLSRRECIQDRNDANRYDDSLVDMHEKNLRHP